MVRHGKTVPKYIYQLPIDVNEKLCRLLDIEDRWRVLARTHMRFLPQTIDEIEQTARHHNTSPTNDLLIRWGQMNHTVLELCKLLYVMNCLPALQCLEMQVEDRRLLRALEKKNEKKERIKCPTRPEPTISSTVMVYRHEEIDEKHIRQRVPGLPMIPYEDLLEATNDWSTEIGEGGFGTVYKGLWKEMDIAIKRLKLKNTLNEGLIKELWPNRYRHENLVPIYGYSLRGEESCLVYPLMTGGSLKDRLYNKTPYPALTWTQRRWIAHGVAKGLQHLHEMEKTPLIHGDIKPANILLDQYGVPKIADFGFAREGHYDSENKTHMIVTSRLGTPGYSPSEYRNSGILSSALDVFSFGVVLMEMATRKPALLSKEPEVSLRDYIIKERKGNDYATLEDKMVYRQNPDLCRAFITLGLRCTKDRKDRPTMLEVYKEVDAMNIPCNPDF